MYVGLKQPRGDGERYVTPARAAAKETIWRLEMVIFVFWTERDWSQKSFYGNNNKGVICLFCDGHLWCQVSRTLL